MNHKYNIYDAFLYKYKKFILALSYTPNFNINYVIDDIVKTFNFSVVKLEGINDGPIILKEDTKFNFNKLNNDVQKLLDENQFNMTHNLQGYFGKGILIYGLNFPDKELKFTIDLHLHFSTSMSLFLKSNLSTNNQPQYNADDYNKFKDILSTNKIHKYFNIKSDPSVELCDAIFDKIIDFMEFKIYGKKYEELASKNKKEQAEKLSTNPNLTDTLKISEQNEKIKEQVDIDKIDASLAISANNADSDTKFDDTKKLGSDESDESDASNESNESDD